MREKHFNNPIFNSLDEVEETLCKAFNDLIAAPEQVRSMTFFPHLRISFWNATWCNVAQLRWVV
jgi:hypothetical protein